MSNQSSFSSSITLKLITNEEGASDTAKEISVPLNSTFNAIFDDYETKSNIQHKALQYIYRGRLIKGSETPAGLKMKDGASIEIYDSSSSYTNKVNKSQKIILFLVDPDGIEHPSEIKIDRKIKDWLKTRCSNQNLNFDSLSFFINDKLIDIDKTPHKLKLSNNDKIYARYRNNTSISDANTLKCHDVQSNIYSPETNTTPLANPEHELITINIKTPRDKIIQIQVDPNQTFKHSFKSFLKQHHYNVTDYFLFFNRVIINGKNTPNDLQMKDGDTIKLERKKERAHHNDSHSSKSTEDDNPPSTCLLI